MSLRLRLFVLTVAVFVVAIVAAGAALPTLVRGYLVDQVDAKLSTVGVAAAARLAQVPLAEEPGTEPLVLLDGAYLSIRRGDGSVVVEGFLDAGDSEAQVPYIEPVRDQLRGGGVASVDGTGEGRSTRYRVTRIELPGRRLRDATDVAVDQQLPSEVRADLASGELEILAALPLTEVERSVDRIVLLEATIGALLVVIVAVGTWWIVGVGLRPLRTMEDTAESLRRDGFEPGRRRGRRVAHPSTRTEIGRLGATLNGLFDDVDSALERRHEGEQRLRRFVADASHELRTPLTSIAGYAQLLRRADLDTASAKAHIARVESETARMTTLVEDLLHLARLDALRQPDRRPVSISPLLEALARDARASDGGRRIRVEAAAHLSAVADELDLTQALLNLLVNARTHTPQASPIELRAIPGAEGTIRIDVVDHGGGVPPADRERIFDRFARRDESRQRASGGAGLGLAIVRAIVEAHDGAIEVTDTPGGGATFSVTLRRGPDVRVESLSVNP